MHVTVNLSGIPVYVGLYREGRLYQVDPADTYFTNDKGDCLAPVDDVDRVGTFQSGRGWLSLRFLAEEAADQKAREMDRDARAYADEMKRAG